ncbi:MAG: DUF2218 domain-containing protein [Pseudomonadaceae bacterium]|nr:DUF2218 domain-containing protein [Pseudomonadaceae bacterium]
MNASPELQYPCSRVATVATANPSRLINRLCKHWAHKFPVRHDEQGGEITLGVGECRLRAAEAGLEVSLHAADPAQLRQLQQVVADHLLRMASGEALVFAWHAGVGAAPSEEPNRLHDTRERYGRISRGFHWLMAGLIVWQFLKLGDRIDEGEHWIGQTLVPWHISIGALLLVLVVLRVVWASTQRGQRPLPDPATAVLVKGGHLALYACMLLLPVSGILFMLGNGYGLEVFGVQLATKGPEIAWAASLGSIHSPLAWLTVLLVVGHAGIALLHHLVRRDGVLQRML